MVHVQQAVMSEYRFDSQSAAQLTGPLLRSKLSGD
jgi:hypothetical protein